MLLKTLVSKLASVATRPERSRGFFASLFPRSLFPAERSLLQLSGNDDPRMMTQLPHSSFRGQDENRAWTDLNEQKGYTTGLASATENWGTSSSDLGGPDFDDKNRSDQKPWFLQGIQGRTSLANNGSSQGSWSFGNDTPKFSRGDISEEKLLMFLCNPDSLSPIVESLCSEIARVETELAAALEDEKASRDDIIRLVLKTSMDAQYALAYGIPVLLELLKSLKTRLEHLQQKGGFGFFPRTLFSGPGANGLDRALEKLEREERAQLLRKLNGIIQAIPVISPELSSTLSAMTGKVTKHLEQGKMNREQILRLIMNESQEARCAVKILGTGVADAIKKSYKNPKGLMRPFKK